MTRTYCDCCGDEVFGHSLERDFNAKEYIIRAAVTQLETELILCSRCSDRFTYLLQNREALRQGCNKMRLMNRVRFLFKLPPKEG